MSRKTSWLMPAWILKPATGQAGLITIAVFLVIMLVLVGGSLSNMSFMRGQRNIVNNRSLQAYYNAQAGVQEALATRMVPRSNFLNFISTNSTPFNINLPNAVTPTYASSGLVFQRPDLNTQLLGTYRYIILGGDPSRKADSSYYGIPAGPPFAVGPDVTNNSSPTPRLVTFQSNPPDSPFYIVSNGTSCVKNNGTSGKDVGIDQFVSSTATVTSAKNLILDAQGAPQCKTGYTRQEMTVVAQVSVEQESGAMDKVTQIRMYSRGNNIPLPASTFIPGVGWGNTLDFNTAWGSQSTITGQTPARPTRLVFFKFGPNNIYQSVDLTTGATITVPGTVPIDASMMIYFDGPIDYRSVSSDVSGSNTYLYNKDLSGCKGATSSNCAFQLLDGSTKVQYTGMLVVPILPYQTKFLLLAPLGNNLGNNKPYELDIYTSKVKSFSYAAAATTGAKPLVVQFKTQ